MLPPLLPSVSLLIFLLLWQPGCRGLTVAPPHFPRTCFAASLSICTVGNTLSPALQMAGRQVCGSTSAGRLVGHARDSNSTPVLKGLPLLLTPLGSVPLLGYSYTTLSQLVPHYFSPRLALMPRPQHGGLILHRVCASSASTLLLPLGWPRPPPYLSLLPSRSHPRRCPGMVLHCLLVCIAGSWFRFPP